MRMKKLLTNKIFISVFVSIVAIAVAVAIYFFIPKSLTDANGIYLEVENVTVEVNEEKKVELQSSEGLFFTYALGDSSIAQVANKDGLYVKGLKEGETTLKIRGKFKEDVIEKELTITVTANQGEDKGKDTEPTIPENPITPTDPTTPEKPENPIEPTNPEKPTEPEQPKEDDNKDEEKENPEDKLNFKIEGLQNITYENEVLILTEKQGILIFSVDTDLKVSATAILSNGETTKDITNTMHGFQIIIPIQEQGEWTLSIQITVETEEGKLLTITKTFDVVFR